MSAELLEERVGKLETGQARQEERLGRIETDLAKAAGGIEKLLERDARRGEALSFKSVAATCGGLAAIAMVVWWLIDASPAVRRLQERIDHAEWKYGWTGRIDKE